VKTAVDHRDSLLLLLGFMFGVVALVMTLLWQEERADRLNWQAVADASRAFEQDWKDDRPEPLTIGLWGDSVCIGQRESGWTRILDGTGSIVVGRSCWLLIDDTPGVVVDDRRRSQ